MFQTRCKSLQTNAEVFRKEIERFLEKLLLTNSLFIYAPSQVALAAIIHGAGCNNENVDSYVTDTLFNGDINDEKLKNIIDTVRSKLTQNPYVGVYPRLSDVTVTLSFFHRNTSCCEESQSAGHFQNKVHQRKARTMSKPRKQPR